jgi:RNA polymerase sigma factor (sigma-70 family)
VRAAEELSNEVLLAGLGAGDPDLAAAFVRRFQRNVFGVALAVTGDSATAEDVVQRAFEQAWRHASVYDSRRGSVRAWVTTMTHNFAIDVVRTRSALPMDPADLPVVLAAMTDDPERVAVANDSAQGLRRALAGLPVLHARAVAMSGIYGMSAQQVADTEGIPLGTAKTRIRDGMQKLRAAFLPREADDTTRPEPRPRSRTAQSPADTERAARMRVSRVRSG